MDVLKFAVGIDCSKAELEVCLGSLDHSQRFTKWSGRSFNNDRKGLGELHRWVREQVGPEPTVQFVIEATGVYYELAADELLERGERISVVLPNKARSFADTLRNKTITDKTDAKALAQMGAEKDLDGWNRPDPVFRELRELTRERMRLIDQRKRTKNQLEATTNSLATPENTDRRTRSLKAFLNEQIKEVEREIREKVKAHPSLWKKVKKACTIPGVGMMTVITIAAETDGFNLVRNKKQLVSYAGYDVIGKQSGTSVQKRPKVSKKGNAEIRRALYFPAITTVRKETPRMKALYERLVEEKGPKMKGYTAVQRKLLVLVHALWTKEEDFDPNYEHQSESKKEGRPQEETALAG